MPAIPKLEKIREEIQNKMIADNVNQQSNGNDKPLHNGLAVVPESEIILSMQWLQNSFLPEVEKVRGVDNAQYKKFVRVLDAIAWSMYIMRKYERKIYDLHNANFLMTAYRERLAVLEQRLLKYETAEDLMNAEQLKDYQDAIVKQALKQFAGGIEKKEDI